MNARREADALASARLADAWPVAGARALADASACGGLS